MRRGRARKEDADSGILHTLLDLETAYDLERHPKVGASWEGFLLI